MGSTDILEVLAATCEQQARLFLDCPPDPSDEDALGSSRQFAIDALEWETANGDQDPAWWLSQVVGCYLAEGSHQLKVLASLLRSREVHGTLEPVIRAILERCGRICWLLDPTSSAAQRAARCQLEVGVCALHYAEALSLLDADSQSRDELRRFRGEHRARVHDRYTVETHGEKKDMSAWTVDGQSYPGYTETVAYALSDHPMSSGMYAGLSGFSHPNVFFGGERRNQTVATRSVMIMHTDSIERTLRVAVGSHIAATKRWAAYYLDHPTADAVVAECDRLADILDEASVLEADPLTDSPQPPDPV